MTRSCGELSELRDAELDLALLGFGEDELAALLAEAATAATTAS